MKQTRYGDGFRTQNLYDSFQAIHLQFSSDSFTMLSIYLVVGMCI